MENLLFGALVLLAVVVGGAVMRRAGSAFRSGYRSDGSDASCGSGHSGDGGGWGDGGSSGGDGGSGGGGGS